MVDDSLNADKIFSVENGQHVSAYKPIIRYSFFIKHIKEKLSILC